MQTTQRLIGRGLNRPAQPHPAADEARALAGADPAGDRPARDGLGRRRCRNVFSWPVVCAGLFGLGLAYLASRTGVPTQPTGLPVDLAPAGPAPRPAESVDPAGRGAGPATEEAVPPFARLSAANLADIAAGRDPAAVGRVATAMGGPDISAAQRRLLVELVCREPGDIAHLDDRALGRHARAVARALRQVIVHTAADPGRVTLAQRQASEEERLREVMDILMQTRFADPRWQSFIAITLQDLDHSEERGIRLDEARWDTVIFQKFTSQVAMKQMATGEGQSAYEIPPLESRAIMTLKANGKKLEMNPEHKRLAMEALKMYAAGSAASPGDAPRATAASRGQPQGKPRQPAS